MNTQAIWQDIKEKFAKEDDRVIAAAKAGLDEAEAAIARGSLSAEDAFDHAYLAARDDLGQVENFIQRSKLVQGLITELHLRAASAAIGSDETLRDQMVQSPAAALDAAHAAAAEGGAMDHPEAAGGGAGGP